MRGTEERMAALDAYPERAPIRGLGLMASGFVGILMGLTSTNTWTL